MRGDIVRALIETITNSDDAYAGKPGKIRIEVDHRRGQRRVVTRDRATGIPAAKMKSAIASIGEQTSGFSEGADVRGNLGRGSKDLAAFGQVEFESICEDRLSRMLLEPDGEYTLFKDLKPSSQDRERLGIPRGNGTVVTIAVTDHIRLPSHDKLYARLSQHYQLRDIMSDPAREVRLIDLAKDKNDVLRYSYPSVPVVLSSVLDIGGYPHAVAKLTIFRNAEAYDDAPTDPSRPAGILIKGRRAIYENTLFKFESNPYAGWFSGSIECAFIDDLAAEYDRRMAQHETHVEANPMPIISRRRDGLQKSHPFYKALAGAIEQHLAILVGQEEKAARARQSTESSRLRSMLNSLGRDLSKLVDEDLREIDEEGLAESTGPGATSSMFRVVPHDDIVLFMGETKTVSVIVGSARGHEEASAVVEPAETVEVIGGPQVQLGQHRSRPDLMTGQIQLRPLAEQEAILTVTLGSESKAVLLQVEPERIIEEIPLTPVGRLSFERDKYRVACTKKKALRVFATLEEVAEHGNAVRVASSDAGVLARQHYLTLSLDEELEQFVGEITVEGRKLASKSTIVARLGDISASTVVYVAKEEAGPSLHIQVVDEEQGNYRAIVDREAIPLSIRIMGRHPVMRRFRGPDHSGDDSPATQVLIAEIVADQIARIIIERKYPITMSGEPLDAARFYAEHYRYLSKYLDRCHRLMAIDANVK